MTSTFFTTPNSRPVYKLRAREVQVLQCVADGMPNKEIAQELGISPGTVKVHLAKAARKFGTSGDRAGLVYMALKNGLIQ
jgi:DNA-binding NarL/FixJ family response regulator